MTNNVYILLFGMILCIDCGNTRIKAAVFSNEKIISFDAHVHENDSTGIADFINRFAKYKISHSAISSVVPSLTKSIYSSIDDIFSVPSLIIKGDISLPIRLLYDNPVELGPDRIADVTAGLKYSPDGCIVIDAGTALTINIINEDKTFLGGLILPGISTAFSSLFHNAELLDHTLQQNESFVELIARNKKGAIESGVRYGWPSMVDSIIDKIENELQRKFLCIITGGGGELLHTQLNHESQYVSSLTLEGIYLLLCYNTKKYED